MAIDTKLKELIEQVIEEEGVTRERVEKTFLEGVFPLKFENALKTGELSIFRFFNAKTEPNVDVTASWSWFEDHDIDDPVMEFVNHVASATVPNKDVDWLETMKLNLYYPEESEIILKRTDNVEIYDIDKLKDVPGVETPKIKKKLVRVKAHAREEGKIKIKEYTRAAPSKGDEFNIYKFVKDYESDE